MKWETTTLGAVTKIVSGSTPKSGVPEYWGGSILWATPTDLSGLMTKELVTTERTITEAGLSNCSANMLPARSVLFSSRAPIGLVAINAHPVCTNQGFKSFVPKSDLLFPDFLYWWLKVNRSALERMGRGATFKEVSKSIVEQIQIPLPPLVEQERIAAILDAADALRAKRRESLAQLDTLLQSTFLDMFGDPVTNPKGWKISRLGQLMRIRRGGSPRPIDKYLGGSINWIKIGDATNTGDDLYITSCSEKIIEEGLNKTTLLEPGSFVFANSGVSLGFARILKIKGAIHDGWLAFDQYSTEVVNELFFLKALNGITEHFRRIAPSGTQPNLNTGIMKSFELILPPIDLQRCFADIVESVEQQKVRLREHLAELDTLFTSLQHRAFRGEL